MPNSYWFFLIGALCGLGVWASFLSRKNAIKAKHARRRREPVAPVQTIITEKPKCYGKQLTITTSCNRCQHKMECGFVSLNLYLIDIGYGQPLEYNYPDLRNTYE